MKVRVILLMAMLVAVTAVSVQARSFWSFGVNVGPGYYGSPYYGGYAYAAPPPVAPPYGYGSYYRPVAPGPGYSWINGYYYPYGGRYMWRNGYWGRPPYAGARWYAPRYYGGRYYRGRWGR